MAQQAAAQLAFERQETLPAYIQSDYWQPPQDAASATVQSATAPDRRGLTGSARLLQDIYQLDQYAFEKNTRKQQLTKTISLRELDPFAFQQFLDTGVLPFTLPMDLFDWDFPGHYLRLIRQIRTTVIALIPPNQGIRASLSSTGMSRVVVDNGMFQTQILRRPPETLSLSAPYNSTGLFDLQQSTDMTLPFEGLGVATSFEFSLPKAANPFDYASIADLLVTMDYTALHSFDYRDQLIQRLNSSLTRSADRAYSFRGDFADAWYDLNNPDQSATPMSVSFETETGDFPPNMTVAEDRAGRPLCCTRDRQQARDRRGGSAARADRRRVARRSLRDGQRVDQHAWREWRSLAVARRRASGRHLATHSARADMRSRFQNEEITDLLLVITFNGTLPPWPA